MLTKLNSFFRKCIRVWHILRKPDSYEFKSIAKISALGLVGVGLIGFMISLVVNIFK